MKKTISLRKYTGRLLSVLLALALLVSLVPAPAQAASALPFTDVSESDWFYPAVRYCYMHGIFSGTSDTTFSPNSSLTRAQVVTILGREQKADLSGEDSLSGWADVPDSCYYIRYLNWAAGAALINGTSCCDFSPENAITRQDMATILGRLKEHFGILFTQSTDSQTLAFLDADSIADYARSYVESLRDSGILAGDAGSFHPAAVLTRAQAAAVLQRLDERTVRCEKIEAPASLTVPTGKDLQLDIRYLPEPCSMPMLSYSSSNTALLTVSDKGVLHGVHDGRATVSVTAAGGPSACVSVTVGTGDDSQDSTIPLTAIRCAFDLAGNKSIELAVGSQEQICTTLIPENTTQTTPFTFTSSNTGVATVYSSGLVRAVGSGTAQITIQAVNGLSDTLTVTVPEPTEEGHGTAPTIVRPDQKNSDWIDAQLAGIVTPGMSDYAKAEAIAKYICDYMTYDYSYYKGRGRTVTIAAGAPSYSEPYGVCQDYADRYSAFCGRAGLEAAVETGEANSGDGPYYLVPLETAWQGHAWNSVICDGTKYYIDTCWMDGGTGYDTNGKYEMFYSLSPDYWADHRQDGVRGTKSRFDTSNMEVLCCDGSVTELDLRVGQQYYAYVPYRGYPTKSSWKKEQFDGYAEERYCTGEGSYGWEQVMTITHSGRQVITIAIKNMDDKVIDTVAITINATD